MAGGNNWHQQAGSGKYKGNIKTEVKPENKGKHIRNTGPGNKCKAGARTKKQTNQEQGDSTGLNTN